MDDFFDKNWYKNPKFIWWLLLMIFGILYINNNLNRILENPHSVDIIVFLSFITIIFMPLVSEIKIFGMSLKKEIEDTRKEMKNEIKEMKFDLLEFNLNNSQNNDINIVNHLPSKEDIENDMENSENNTEESEEEIQENSEVDLEISEDQTYLFQVRYKIEQKLRNIINYYGTNTQLSIVVMIEILYKIDLLDKSTGEYIKRVISICNRGIHGEIIDDQYIEYTKKMVPKIIKKLDLALEKADNYNINICTRCGYKGISKYDNVCPKCGFVTDDY